MTDINSTLQERGERYGSFEHHAKIAQDLQRVMHADAGWTKLADDQRQALTVIADKIARMLNGDPAYRDNWHDIVGYAKLVDDRMARDESAARIAAADASYAPMPESATTHTGGFVPAKPSDQYRGEEPSDYCLPPVKNPLPMPECAPAKATVMQATHRDAGRSYFRQDEKTGRWLQWGVDGWFFASVNPAHVPDGLHPL